MLEAISEVLENESSKIVDGRLKRQRIAFYQVDTYVVKYEYLGRSYRAVVNASVGTVFAPISPFTELAMDYINKANAQIKMRHYGDAMRLANEAYRFSEGTPQSQTVTDLIDTIAGFMPYHYYVGIVVGAWISIGYQLVLMIVSFFSRYKYSYSGLAFTIVTIIVMYLLLRYSEKRLTILLARVKVIRNDKLRMLIGAAASAVILYIVSHLG